MDKRFFLKEVIVDSRKNQKLSSLQVKLQGPMLVPCGGNPSTGLAQTPPPRAPAVCQAHEGGVGKCSGEDEAENQGAWWEALIHRDEKEPPGHQGRPCGFLQIWANFNISYSRWKKSVVGLECVRRDQRKLSSLNQARVCCPQVFTG